MKPLNSVGVSIPKVDARGKATGETLYAGDRSLPEMVYVRVVRSECAHAEILAIDCGNALDVPGLVGVWTARDLPGATHVGPRVKDEPVLCGHKVRRVGDPLVLVAAETEAAVRDAAGLVKVTLRELPVVTSPEAAMAPDAPRVHEGDNVLFSSRVMRGDAEAALRDCVHVIENAYRTQMIEHAYLEPEAGISYPEGDTITVELPTKHAHFDQGELSRVLNMATEKVRIICATIGGYFGDKQCLSPGYYSAIVTRLTGRPAKMVYGRKESFEASTKRHPFTIKMVTGADAEGRLLAVKADITADTGAYASYGQSILTRAVVHAAGPYRVDNVFIEGRVVYTNNPTCGAMRGFGAAQAVLAYETQMELLAKAVGKSSAEIRRINFLKPGDFNATEQELKHSVGIDACLAAVEKRKSTIPPHPHEQNPRYLTGWGMAAMHYGIGLTGLPNPGVAQMALTAGRPIRVGVGTGDGGQGAFTTLTQIAAETLCVRPDDIKLVAGDTACTPNSGTSTASRVTYVVGRAVYEAGLQLIEAVKSRLSEIWKTDAVTFEDGWFLAEGKRVPFTGVADFTGPMEVEGTFDPPTKALDKETGKGIPYATYSFAVQAAQVSIDRETGQVRVLRMVAAHDVGKVVHPVNVVGQVHGGILMGLGYGLMEKVVLKEGRIMNPGYRAYLIPSSMEMPEFYVDMVESPEPTGPFGAKGVGEPALLPTAPAIHNAIGDALGRYPMKIPVTAEDIWFLLRSE